MVSLYSYTIPIDDGAAPNPFGGMCTLAICKPVIRRTASEGDWIVGLGSVNAPSGNLSGHVVYAMEVSEILTLERYDRCAPKEWPHRIPGNPKDIPRNFLGDCIYDFAGGPAPRQRLGVHGNGNIETDLGGCNALISRNFYYFGRNAIKLPDNLRPIIHQTQGHKKQANQQYLCAFVTWITSLGFKACHIYGPPDTERKPGDSCDACEIRKMAGELDEEASSNCA